MVKAGRYYWSDNEETAFCAYAEAPTKNMDECPIGFTDACAECKHFWESIYNYEEAMEDMEEEVKE